MTACKISRSFQGALQPGIKEGTDKQANDCLLKLTGRVGRLRADGQRGPSTFVRRCGWPNVNLDCTEGAGVGMSGRKKLKIQGMA